MWEPLAAAGRRLVQGAGWGQGVCGCGRPHWQLAGKLGLVQTHAGSGGCAGFAKQLITLSSFCNQAFPMVRESCCCQVCAPCQWGDSRVSRICSSSAGEPCHHCASSPLLQQGPCLHWGGPDQGSWHLHVALQVRAFPTLTGEDPVPSGGVRGLGSCPHGPCNAQRPWDGGWRAAAGGCSRTLCAGGCPALLWELPACKQV